MVEIKLALADACRSATRKHRLSQGALAARTKSSQSRVAKIEAGDPSVSIDLLVRAALAAGATKKELGKVIAVDESARFCASVCAIGHRASQGAVSNPTGTDRLSM